MGESDYFSGCARRPRRVAARGRPIAPARIPRGRSCPKRQEAPEERAVYARVLQPRVLQPGTAKAGWAELLARVFGEGGFRCPRCGGPMVLRCLVLQAGFGTARDDEVPTEPRERGGAAVAAVEGSTTGGCGERTGPAGGALLGGQNSTKKPIKRCPIGPPPAVRSPGAVPGARARGPTESVDLSYPRGVERHS